MLFLTAASLLLAGTAWAQTPSGFTPSVSAPLDVYYGTTFITPGLTVPQTSQ